MSNIAHDEYKIDVCSICGERVLAVGYLCNHIPMHEAESVTVEVVPKRRLQGAVEERDRLLAAIQHIAANDPMDLTAQELAEWTLDNYRTGGQ